MTTFPRGVGPLMRDAAQGMSSIYLPIRTCDQHRSFFYLSIYLSIYLFNFFFFHLFFLFLLGSYFLRTCLARRLDTCNSRGLIPSVFQIDRADGLAMKPGRELPPKTRLSAVTLIKNRVIISDIGTHF